MNTIKPKIVLFNCDKCGKHDTLVAYHNSFGWYCKECLCAVRDRMSVLIDYMDITEEEINKTLENKL